MKNKVLVRDIKTGLTVQGTTGKSIQITKTQSADRLILTRIELRARAFLSGSAVSKTESPAAPWHFTSRKSCGWDRLFPKRHRHSSRGPEEIMISQIMDNGGRRLGFERRQFSYDGYIPERRSHVDRRCGIDRRANPGAYRERERRAIFQGENTPAE